MSKKIYDAAASTGEYKDRQTGETKKRWQNVGAVFEGDDGRLSLKLETIPVGPGWSGWISFFPPKDERREQPRNDRQERQQSPHLQKQEQAPANYGPDTEDDIPF